MQLTHTHTQTNNVAIIFMANYKFIIEQVLCLLQRKGFSGAFLNKHSRLALALTASLSLALSLSLSLQTSQSQTNARTPAYASMAKARRCANHAPSTARCSCSSSIDDSSAHNTWRCPSVPSWPRVSA